MEYPLEGHQIVEAKQTRPSAQELRRAETQIQLVRQLGGRIHFKTKETDEENKFLGDICLWMDAKQYPELAESILNNQNAVVWWLIQEKYGNRVKDLTCHEDQTQ